MTLRDSGSTMIRTAPVRGLHSSLVAVRLVGTIMQDLPSNTQYAVPIDDVAFNQVILHINMYTH